VIVSNPAVYNVNRNTRWSQNTTGTITVGTTSIVYGITTSFADDRDQYINHLALANSLSDEGGANVQFAAAATPDKMNLIAREYWIASFGNGVEAYNLIRRTGMPTGLQPTIIATSSVTPFPRSYWYPQTYATLNANAVQKASVGEHVFWDNNTANLDY
jgi:hypothetical protein